MLSPNGGTTVMVTVLPAGAIPEILTSSPRLYDDLSVTIVKLPELDDGDEELDADETENFALV